MSALLCQETCPYKADLAIKVSGSVEPFTHSVCIMQREASETLPHNADGNLDMWLSRKPYCVSTTERDIRKYGCTMLWLVIASSSLCAQYTDRYQDTVLHSGDHDLLLGKEPCSQCLQSAETEVCKRLHRADLATKTCGSVELLTCRAVWRETGTSGNIHVMLTLQP